MASDLSGGPTEYEGIVRHSEGTTSTFYDSVYKSTSDDPSFYEDVDEFSLKHNESKDRHKNFTYSSTKAPTRKKNDSILQKTKKMLNTEKISNVVGKKCTTLQKCFGIIKHKGKEKPQSVSECLSSKPDTVTNTYQADVTRPKLPQRNQKTYVRLPANESTLSSPSHYMSMTYKPNEEKTAVYQNSIPESGLQSEQSNELAVDKDDHTDSDDGTYLRPEPRQTGFYKQYLLKKQNKIESQKVEIMKEEPSSDNPEKRKKTKTSESDDDSDYETMGPKTEIGAGTLLGTSAGNGSQIATNDSSKEDKSVDNPSGSGKIESGRPNIVQLNIKGVIQVLKDLDLEKYADTFEANKIDGQILTHLVMDDFIKELEMKKMEAYRLDIFIKTGHVPS